MRVVANWLFSRCSPAVTRILTSVFLSDPIRSVNPHFFWSDTRNAIFQNTLTLLSLCYFISHHFFIPVAVFHLLCCTHEWSIIYSLHRSSRSATKSRIVSDIDPRVDLSEDFVIARTTPKNENQTEKSLNSFRDLIDASVQSALPRFANCFDHSMWFNAMKHAWPIDLGNIAKNTAGTVTHNRYCRENRTGDYILYRYANTYFRARYINQIIKVIRSNEFLMWSVRL